jgi:hypothetical protein
VGEKRGIMSTKAWRRTGIRIARSSSEMLYRSIQTEQGSMPSSHGQLLQQVIDRAATDPDFRTRLLELPNAAIFDTFGVAIPAAIRVRFVEKPADVDVLVVLPDPHAQDELDDGDLDAVAGGGGETPW